jgi:formylglycine-generating enzyme required for sulfatase activity
MSTPADAIPPECFPPRLAELGYEVRLFGGAQVILPPLCEVPAGEFLMGSDPRQDTEADDREQPQHRVALAAYQIARFPVTVAEYACCVRADHAKLVNVLPWMRFSRPTRRQHRGRMDHPVVSVSWRDTVAYAAWLAKTTSQPWRLATEAEWEKAARWDPATRHARIYPWGDSFEQWRCNTHGSGKDTTTPVGTYATGASPFGAQDMAGNVWEWTSTLYRPYPYNPTDGREDIDSTVSRVLRGGSWNDGPQVARAAFRAYDNPDLLYGFIGFRVVRAVPGSTPR